MSSTGRQALESLGRGHVLFLSLEQEEGTLMTVLPLLRWECCSIVSWYSIPLLVEKLRGAGSGREAVLVRLLLPLAASINHL